MKTFAVTLFLNVAVVVLAALIWRQLPDASAILAGHFSATLLAWAWKECGRTIRPLRPSGQPVRLWRRTDDPAPPRRLRRAA
jgi:hypothetical protein